VGSLRPDTSRSGRFGGTVGEARVVGTAFPRSKILGTGHYLPAKVVTNLDLEKTVDTSDEWIRGRTGIQQRHVAAPDEASSDMATKAAKHALEAAGLQATDLDLIIVGTISPDMQLPSTAMFVQRNLRTRPDCPGFDLAAACAGFIYGLSVADAFVRSGGARYVLVIGVELLSRLVDWDDRNTCVLFGDGAGAVIVGPSEDPDRGILSTHLFADGTQIESLCIPAGGTRTPITPELIAQRQHLVHMAGREVFKYAVKALSGSSQVAMSANGLTAADIDWLIPHQANLRIIEAVLQRSGIPRERCFVNIDKAANTSSASVPIALDQAVRLHKVQPGQNVLFCALGGGFAWGSALVRW
jgi:3-oxoacyl-[acyl-carrier-protein] synthase-3